MAFEEIVQLVFYVDPETESVDAVFSFTDFGMFDRIESEWEYVLPEDSGLYGEYAEHLGYVLDWETDEVVIDENFDFDDYETVTPTAVKLFDKDELTLETLKKYANLKIEPISKEEMDKQIKAHQKLHGK